MRKIVKNTLKYFGLLSFVKRIAGYKSPENIDFKKLEEIQEHLIRKSQKKDKLTVVFFLYFSSTWKYDKIYKLMQNDKNFEPIIIIIPMSIWDQDTMVKEMQKTYKWFNERNYTVIKSYDEKLNIFLDVDKNISPDIVFYSEPYDNATIVQYRSSTWYKKALLCYSVYGFNMALESKHLYNLYFHNILWKIFAETLFSKQESRKYAYNKGKNVVFTGAPACDIYIDNTYSPLDVWNNTKKKRVIYSPHYYTIDSTDDGWATFSKNHQIMIEIVKKFENSIYFIFKPHPYLKNTLYNHNQWGKKKTDEYYAKWENMSNSHIALDDYANLFLTSDALIHDSGSFTFEYIYTKKPSMFLYKDSNMNKRWNSNAMSALDVLYPGHNKDDIVSFLNDVIIAGNDTLKNKRLFFLKENLLPANGESASVNIFEIIKKELNK